MFSLERIHDPGTAIFTVMICLAALLVASFPIIKMIGWWIEGGAEPLQAMLAIFMYLALIAWSMAAPAGIAVLIFLIILFSAIAAPVLGTVSDQAQLRRMDDERLRQYAVALERNPRDPAARMALAEALHKKGEVDQAIEHMTWTLQEFPSLGMRIKPELAMWEREKVRSAGPVSRIYCHECHAENPTETDHCLACGAVFGTRAGIQREVWKAGGPKVVIRGWITVAGTFILALLFLSIIPVEFAAPLILATCIVAAWLFLRWLGGNMGTAGD